MTARSDLSTQLRIASGLVLMMFVAGHLINHALTLHSLEAVAAGRMVFIAIWRSLPGSILLYGALLAHMVLTLLKLYQRRRLKMPLWEVVQVLLGLAIPFWLILHVIGTRGAHQVFGVDDSYLMQFAGVWPVGAGRHTTMLLLVWLHGCIGMHFWLRFRPWYARVRLFLLMIALVLPAAALAGFHLGGREVQAIVTLDPNWLPRIAEEQGWLDEESRGWVYRAEDRLLGGFLLLLALVVAARLIRLWRERAAGMVHIRYLDGSSVSIEPGMTVLDGSRIAGIPHASVCGGRGRCSTCRVNIEMGEDGLPPPAEDEARVLRRIAAGEKIRLACQIRPTSDIEVMPLLPAIAEPSFSQVQIDPGSGVEREVAVLFADLRAFTRMAEGRLPFDVVFILNQYFKAMGSAIEGAGGRVDKFIGDAIMVVFGSPTQRADDAERALDCAFDIMDAAKHWSREREQADRESVAIGIGAHYGDVIAGALGSDRLLEYTVIGDTVNIAERLERLSREVESTLVISADLLDAAGGEGRSRQWRRLSNVALKGRHGTIEAFCFDEAASQGTLS